MTDEIKVEDDEGSSKILVLYQWSYDKYNKHKIEQPHICGVFVPQVFCR